MKTTPAILFFSLLLGLMVAGCNPLPKEIPDDLVIELHNNNGMIGWAYGIEANRDSAALTQQFYKIINVYPVAIDKARFEATYQYVRDRNIFSATSHKEEVMDRGGTSITFSFHGKQLTVDNSGQTFLDEKWEVPFQECHKKIDSLIAEEIQALYVPVTIHVRGKLPPEETHFALNVNSGRFSMKEPLNKTDTSVTYSEKFLPGKAEIAASFGNYPTYYKDYFEIVLPDSGLEINLLVTDTSAKFILPAGTLE